MIEWQGLFSSFVNWLIFNLICSIYTYTVNVCIFDPWWHTLTVSKRVYEIRGKFHLITFYLFYKTPRFFKKAIIDFSLSGDQYHHLACGGNRKNQKLEQYLENDRKAGNTLEKNTSTSALGAVISSGPTTCCFEWNPPPLIDCMAKKLHPRLALYNNQLYD